MLLGSNNSLTYLHPSNMWLKSVGWYGKCQNIDYKKQYTYSRIRFFNFKVDINNKNHVVISNGCYKYRLFSFYEILDFFNKMGGVTILIALESNAHGSNIERVEKRFTEICSIIESIYKDINFCGGYNHSNKKKLYNFAWEKENGMPVMINPYNWSMLYRFVSKCCPMLIGTLNHKYIKKFDKEHGYLMLNYINRH